MPRSDVRKRPWETLVRMFRKLVRSEEGLSLSEYAVMPAARIVCLCMGPVQTLGCQGRSRVQQRVELDRAVGAAGTPGFRWVAATMCCRDGAAPGGLLDPAEIGVGKTD